MIKGREDPRDAKLRERLTHIKYRVAVMSGKGGVGKSTVSANLAWALAHRDHQVGLLDTDIHGPNLPLMFGIAGEQFSAAEEGEIAPIEILPNLHLASTANIGYDADTALIWRGPMKLGLIKQFLSDVTWGDLDYLVIDTPPGTGDEALTVGQYITPMTGIVVVTTPQEVALSDARKSVDFANQLKIPVIGLVENMADGETLKVFGFGGGERAAEELGIPFLGRISLEPSLVASGDGGRVFIAQHPDSEAAIQLEKIAAGVVAWCNGAGG
jgi:ATP-binding protein involved in chromosome partitioning